MFSSSPFWISDFSQGCRVEFPVSNIKSVSSSDICFVAWISARDCERRVRIAPNLLWWKLQGREFVSGQQKVSKLAEIKTARSNVTKGFCSTASRSQENYEFINLQYTFNLLRRHRRIPSSLLAESEPNGFDRNKTRSFKLSWKAFVSRKDARDAECWMPHP